MARELASGPVSRGAKNVSGYPRPGGIYPDEQRKNRMNNAKQPKEDQTPQPDRKSAAKPTVPIERLVALREQGLGPTEIAKLTGTTKQAVSKRLRKYGITAENLEWYKQNRADILAGIQERILKQITDRKIKEASLQQLSTSAAILHDKERLERNLSTSNQALNISIGTLQLRARELRLKHDEANALAAPQGGESPALPAQGRTTALDRLSNPGQNKEKEGVDG